MAKSKARPQVRVDERQRATHADPEDWNRRLIIGGVVAAIAAVIVLIGFGWWWTQIKPLGATVLRVEDTEFSLSHLERRMELELQNNLALYQSEQGAFLLSQGVMQQLEREGKLLAGASELNDITVTDEEVDAEIRERGGLAAGAPPGDFVSELERQVDDSGLKKGEYLQMVRAQLLDEKVRNYFTFVAPESEEQARARWIALRDDQEAEDVLARLEAGEDFGEVAREVSTDTVTAESGGELGWRPRGGFFIDDVEDFLFGAESGERSDVISTSFGSYIVELLERDEDRELDDSQRGAVATRLVNEWFDSLDSKLTVERNLSQDDEIRALNDVFS